MEISESEAQRTGKYHRLTGARPAGFLHSGFRYAPPLIHSPRRALCSFFAQLFFSKLCLTSLTNVHFDAPVLPPTEPPFPNVLPFSSMGSLGAVLWQTPISLLFCGRFCRRTGRLKESILFVFRVFAEKFLGKAATDSRTEIS